MLFYISLGAFAGVVVFGLLFIIMGLKGGPWKLPGIGMMVCFLALIVSVVLPRLGIGGEDPGTANEPSGAVESQDVDESEAVESEGQDEVEGWDALGGVDVNSGLFNVTLTIPSDYVDEGTTQEQLDNAAKEKGFKSATLNKDGSVTYVITKAQHKEMMQEIKDSIDSSLSEMAGSEEYPGIVKVETNSDYTQYKVYLNTEGVGLSESMAILGFYVFSGMYHVFNGTNPDNVNVQFLSESTGQVIQEANSRDMQQ